MKVPLVDLAWQHRQIADEVERGLHEVMETTAFIHGPQLHSFEEAFALFLGVEHCVGVGSGTDALELTVRALDIGPGDVVVVPANSFIASALGILRAGADVVLVDCHPDTYLMDVARVADLIDSKVRAIMPVHLYGQIAPIEDMPDLPERVVVIEDAAQSQGATRNGEGSGSFGVAAATSFYPGKNIGAYGDGGAVLTDDDALAAQVRKLGNWGSAEKYHHPELGFNSRLDTVQAVILQAKLSRLAEWNGMRRAAAEWYREALHDVEKVLLPLTLEGNEHIWHLFVIRVPNRDAVLARLHGRGVGAGIHYPVPMHLQGALSDLGYRRGDFPVTERVAGEILSLPIYPGITEAQQQYVVESLKEALAFS
ncbi:MAG: DegT/DnrJ/EryC1/StrS family aminotransferase [Actinomycetota bacterium]